MFIIGRRIAGSPKPRALPAYLHPPGAVSPLDGKAAQARPRQCRTRLQSEPVQHQAVQAGYRRFPAAVSDTAPFNQPGTGRTDHIGPVSQPYPGSRPTGKPRENPREVGNENGRIAQPAELARAEQVVSPQNNRFSHPATRRPFPAAGTARPPPRPPGSWSGHPG